MSVEIRPFRASDAEAAAAIWNIIVEEGRAFPQEEVLSVPEAERFFASQSYTGIAFDTATGEALGLYILHPNNVGRCGHIANCSYVVRPDVRGRRIGERLVLDSEDRARELGFRIIQFNAVVASNTAALGLYERLGFSRLGTIPGGFRTKDGRYEDIIPHYLVL